MLDYESLKAMAKRIGRPVKDLLALAPGNDPFYAGIGARRQAAVQPRHQRRIDDEVGARGTPHGLHVPGSDAKQEGLFRVFSGAHPSLRGRELFAEITGMPIIPPPDFLPNGR